MATIDARIMNELRQQGITSVMVEKWIEESGDGESSVTAVNELLSFVKTLKRCGGMIREIPIEWPSTP